MMEIDPPYSSGGWKVDDDGTHEIVCSTLPPIPEPCLQLISCGCKSKCRTAACECYKSEQVCTPLCVCNAEGCLNLHSGDTDEYMDHTAVDTDEFMGRTE